MSSHTRTQVSVASTEKAVRVLFWFRTLRLHDNPALQAALRLSPDALYPIWTWDPEYVFAHKVGVNRFNFLIESMRDLSNSLSTRNNNTKLHVVRGAPQTVLPVLWKSWGITHLIFEKDTAGYGAVRDAEIKNLATTAGINVIDILGHTLYDPEAIVKANGGKATMSATAWHAMAKKLPDPPRPIDAPDKIPSPGDTSLPPLARTQHPVERPVDLNSEGRTSDVTVYNTFSGPNGDFGIPTLEELGFPQATTSIRGGETEGLRRLAEYCADGERVATFAKPQTSPAEFEPAETMLLSPYMKFGCVGPREVLWRIRDTITAWKKSSAGKKSTKETKQPENLEGQLMFREMYYAAECAQGLDFGQIRGNSICRYIDWHLQNAYDEDGNKTVPRPLGDPVAEERFLAWKYGRTGFPWIDAIMRQLRQEGWIHHLARHSVACFLTRGQCYISWERGAEVFDEYLIDWDPCSNPGNWMWLSCSAFFALYYRVYGTVTFPTKYDKTGKLVRRFCPELSKYPDKYIYSPHLAPPEVQKKAGCIIGEDYPLPMLDEAVEKQRCVLRIKAAYQAGFYGTDKAVLDGSADALIKKSYAAALETMENNSQSSDNAKSVKRKAGSAHGSVSKKSVKQEGIEQYLSK